jgi:dienelactone hydrolase
VKKSVLILSCCSLIFLLASCSSSDNEETETNTSKQVEEPETPIPVQDVFRMGVVTDSVRVYDHPNESYAIYLPNKYASDSLWPVIFIFDAQGRGALPVRNYQTLADEFGYVLIGSNYSKNGMQSSDHYAHIDHLFHDCYNRFSLSPKRLYTMGFSGGARVAVSAAVKNSSVVGVIGCAAGFPQLKAKLTRKFDYIGFVGDRDFNYQEMYRLKQIITDQEFRNALVTFDGKHEWPETAVMREAFKWNQLNLRRDGLSAKDKPLGWLETEVDQYFALIDQNRFPEASLLLDKIEAFYDQFVPPSHFNKEENFSPRIAEAKSIEAYFEEENQLKEFFLEALKTEQLDWWRTEIAKMNALIAKEIDHFKKASLQRVLSHLSLVTYMYVDGTLKKGQLEPAGFFLEIYGLVDPENPEQPYLKARWLLKQNQPEMAIVELNKSAGLGFSDMKRFQQDGNVEVLKSLRGYNGLVEKIKKNREEN